VSAVIRIPSYQRRPAGTCLKWLRGDPVEP
jgi:hypothetical protein